MSFYDRSKHNFYERKKISRERAPTASKYCTKEIKELPADAVPIDEFPEYFINPQGQIFNRYHEELSTSPDTKGYLKVCLFNNNKRYTRRVHILVAKQFLPVPDELKDIDNIVVDHINQDRTHCSVDNLQWVSQADNIRKAYEQGRVQTTSMPVHCIEDDLEFFSCTQAANHYGLSKITIHQAIKERNGYVKRINKTFEYIKKA